MDIHVASHVKHRLTRYGLTPQRGPDALPISRRRCEGEYQTAETEGTIVLEGSSDDEDRTVLVTKIIDLMATESQTEQIQREVEMLSAIQECKRKSSEMPEVFANRYKACIARYINQSSASHQGDDQQWAVMLLRNAMLTPDTLNAITFQLTAGASRPKNQTVTLDANLVKDLATTVMSAANGEGPPDFSNLTSVVKQQCGMLLSSAERSLSDTSPSITIAAALAALRKVRVTTQVESRAPVATMMAANQDTPRHETETRNAESKI